MSLWDKLTQLFRRATPPPPEITPTTPSLPTQLYVRLQAETERQAVVQVCREMYQTDPRAKGVIKTLARDMVKGCFVVRCPQNPQAEAVANALYKRLSLEQRLDDWVRLTLRDGDTFLEVSVNAALEIAAVTRKPTLEMHRASDPTDRFTDPTRAFWWAAWPWVTSEPPAEAVWFAEWQIIQARWDHDEESRYGQPLFASATGAWKRVREGEVDIAVRRKTRAGLKYVHKFPQGTNTPTIEEYKAINADALDNPTAAIADYFGTVDIGILQGDAQLSEIEDVKHHIRTFFLASPVPMSLLGYGEDLNRDVLAQQQAQYDRALESLTTWVEDEFIKPLLTRQWLLAGIWPADLAYTIEWRSKQPLRASDVREVAEAALKLRALGAPAAAVQALLTQFLPGLDFGELAAESAVASRLAATAEQLRP